MSKELPESVYWLDYETCGLVPSTCPILEIALYRAPFEDPFNLTCVLDTPIFYDAAPGMGPLDYLEQLERLYHPVVVDMHTWNGLWLECRNTRLPSECEVEELICQAIPETPKGEHPPVLAGSSVHFDLDFMRVRMPRAAKRFYHRLLDVSAIKLDCCSQGMPPLPKAEAHRAHADILESIAHLKACRAWQVERAHHLGFESGYQHALDNLAANGA